jgi:hypothetical protein
MRHGSRFTTRIFRSRDKSEARKVYDGPCEWTIERPYSDHEPQEFGLFLAFIGMIMLTVVVAADFIKTVTGIMHDVVPAMALLRSLISVLASLTVTVFFYVFQKSPS